MNKYVVIGFVVCLGIATCIGCCLNKNVTKETMNKYFEQGKKEALQNIDTIKNNSYNSGYKTGKSVGTEEGYKAGKEQGKQEVLNTLEKFNLSEELYRIKK